MNCESRIEQSIKASLRQTSYCKKMREAHFDKFYREFKVRFWYDFLGIIVDMKTPEQRKGYDEYIPDPIMIGDEKKALAWTEKKKIETKTLAISGVKI